jgi:hypothetical protein
VSHECVLSASHHLSGKDQLRHPVITSGGNSLEVSASVSRSAGSLARRLGIQLARMVRPQGGPG